MTLTLSATEPIETSDLSLAAFLLAQGHALDGISGENRRRVFHFAPGAAADARAYYAQAVVPARAFANALRDLKALVREA